MDWPNERYIRFYTRDTVEWLCLDWQARGVMGLLLRVCDRAGVIDLGRMGLRGMAPLLHAQWHEIECHVMALLEDGCIVLEELEGGRQRVLIPNFLEAQEAKPSDAQRKRESRARRRDVTNRDNAVPIPDNPSETAHESGRSRPKTATDRTDCPPTPDLGHSSLPPSQASRAAVARAPAPARVAPSVPATTPACGLTPDQVLHLGTDPRALEIATHIERRCPQVCEVVGNAQHYAMELLLELDAHHKLTVADLCEAMSEAEHDAGPEMPPAKIRQLMRRYVSGKAKLAAKRTTEDADDGYSRPLPPKPPDFEERIRAHRRALIDGHPPIASAVKQAAAVAELERLQAIAEET